MVSMECDNWGDRKNSQSRDRPWQLSIPPFVWLLVVKKNIYFPYNAFLSWILLFFGQSNINFFFRVRVCLSALLCCRHQPCVLLWASRSQTVVEKTISKKKKEGCLTKNKQANVKRENLVADITEAKQTTRNTRTRSLTLVYTRSEKPVFSHFTKRVFVLFFSFYKLNHFRITINVYMLWLAKGTVNHRPVITDVDILNYTRQHVNFAVKSGHI